MLSEISSHKETNIVWFHLHEVAIIVIVVLQKTLESPLDCKEIKQVNPKGNQS